MFLGLNAKRVFRNAGSSDLCEQRTVLKEEFGAGRRPRRPAQPPAGRRRLMASRRRGANPKKVSARAGHSSVGFP
jgi:hypothetical protein